ncbi:MAG TPA: 2-dehydropantoate 2-reductase [Candidatus Dormibacteraeota bacterium]
MKHAILGAGGVGGLLGAALAKAGHPVTLIVRPGAAAGFPNPIHLQSDLLGEVEAEVAVVERLSEPADVLWVAVKAGQLEAALKQAPPGLVDVVVPLLNGVDHLDALRRAYGPERVVTGTIRVEAERLEPGRYRQKGAFIVAELAGRPDLVAELNQAGIQARMVEDGDRALWAKLIMLAPFALTSTASQLSLGQIVEQPEWRDRMVSAMREVKAVAAAQGIELEEPAGMLKVTARDMRTSMQKDAAAGRPLELDHISGPIVRGGREHHVPTPATEELVELVRARYPA